MSDETPLSETISIVVRALNEEEHLGNLIASIKDQNLQPDEVLLVDSGSSDATVEIAEKAGLNVLHMPPSEFTFGRALNWGCEAAKGSILVFVSAHVYALDRCWLENLVAPFEDSRVGLVYGGQTGDHRSTFSELQVLARWFPDEGTNDQRDPFCNNANCAVRSTLWEEIGYDESLPGLEDMAFAKELLTREDRIAYVPEARIAHVHQEHTRQTFNRYRREAMAYKRIFGRTEIDLRQAVALTVRSIGGDLVAALRQRRLRDLGSIAPFRTAQFFGAWSGYRVPMESSESVVRRMYYPK